MSLDSQYVIASDLQSVFRDKDTGLPLAGGKIIFYKDQARTEGKPVYKLSGSPPNYSYTLLGNEVLLNGAGTIDDGLGNDIILYYKPYDDEGNVELYYVVVENAGEIPQFTREGWPNTIDTSSSQQDFTNYIPNGQFLIHTDLAKTDDKEAGEVRAQVTDIAQGGWTFERSAATTAKDFVLFERFGSYVENPSASPRYRVRVKTESPNAGDSIKDLRIKFKDVNKFASDTQKYTFALSGETNTGNDITLTIYLIKNYGTGGSAEDEISLGTITVSTNFEIKQKTFTFGTNDGKTIGIEDDDFLQLAVRFPRDAVFDVSLDNFLLTPDAVDVSQFPQTPNRKMTSQSITPAVPKHDGSNLYLTLRLGAEGLVYDESEVGEIIYESNVSDYVDSLHPSSNKMLANGEKYETNAYSPLGIPYSRLQKKYWNDTLQVPIYGTGADYALALINPAITPEIILASNSSAVLSPASDGATATGFTFHRLHVGVGGSPDSRCRYIAGGHFLIQNKTAAIVTISSAGTSGYTVVTQAEGNGFVVQRTLITPSASTTPGTYFTFYTATADYYVWFQIGGVGSDPAVPGHSGILINLDAGDNPDSVARKIALSLDKLAEVDTILAVGASGIPAGAYFYFNTASDEYYVWYKKAGVGTDPAIADKKPILVEIEDADTATQVASKTQKAINMKYFASPDYRGYFIRATGESDEFLTDFDDRASFIPGLDGDEIGTLQDDSLKSHAHPVSDNIIGVGSGGLLQGGTNVDLEPRESGYTGDHEVRPWNKNATLAIRY